MISIRVDSVAFESEEPQRDTPYFHCLAIRRWVFNQEQGVSVALEFDGLDDRADHFLAWRIDSGTADPVGVARMRTVDGEAKAERVAVLASARRSGAGRFLMNAIEERAKTLGLDSIVLHAQVAVIPFYEKLGYVAEGEIFTEAAIDHVSMSKAVP